MCSLGEDPGSRRSSKFLGFPLVAMRLNCTSKQDPLWAFLRNCRHLKHRLNRVADSRRRSPRFSLT
jgi:hypothetical protein